MGGNPDGDDWPFPQTLDSTEIFVSGSDSWKTVESLPKPSHGLRALNFDNTVFTFGKIQYLKNCFFSIH